MDDADHQEDQREIQDSTKSRLHSLPRAPPHIVMFSKLAPTDCLPRQRQRETSDNLNFLSNELDESWLRLVGEVQEWKLGCTRKQIKIRQLHRLKSGCRGSGRQIARHVPGFVVCPDTEGLK